VLADHCTVCPDFFGRVLGNPSAIFDDEYLRPETQDPDVFADGVDNIVEAMREGGRAHYFADGSIEDACPPIKALLHIMRDGTWEGRNSDDPVFRIYSSATPSFGAVGTAPAWKRARRLSRG